MAGCLFIQERPGAGVATIPLEQIKHAVMLKLVRGNRVESYPLKSQINPTLDPVSPDGDPEITIQIEQPGQRKRNYPLANWPHAVAVTVSDMLFWLEDGRWRLGGPGETRTTARSVVEARYCPEGYDLPDNAR